MNDGPALPQSLVETANGFDERGLRDAFGCFATGVTVVTTRDAAGRPVGMTVNSFSSVSLEPPLVLWCLARDCDEFAAFDAAPRFAISVLAADQQDLSRRFASRDPDRFDGVPIRDGAGGVPLIDGCQAWFECRVAHRYPGGDHVILVGAVERFAHGPGAPLVYYRSRYGTVVD